MFFQKQVFGIDISDYSVELLELEKTGPQIKVRSYARIILEKGVVENGKIISKGVLVSEIAKLLERAEPYLPKVKHLFMFLNSQSG